MQRRPPKVYIGIDPGTETGIATGKENSHRFTNIGSASILDAFDVVLEIVNYCGQSHVHVCVEDARKNILPKHLQTNTGREQDMGVGSVRRDCAIWEDFLKRNKIKHTMTDPRKRRKKVKAPEFKELTGWTKRNGNNEHSRDAAMVIYPYVFITKKKITYGE